LASHYDLKVNGSDLTYSFSCQVAANEWSSVSYVPDSMEAGNLPEGVVPRGSLEVRVLRKLDEGWSESIRVENHDERSRHVERQIAVSCPIGDVQFAEEMKRSTPTSEGVKPEILWKDGRPKLRFSRNYGKRDHAPTDELRRLLGDQAPRSGDDVVRGLELELQFSKERGAPPIFYVEEGKITRIRIELEIFGR